MTSRRRESKWDRIYGAQRFHYDAFDALADRGTHNVTSASTVYLKTIETNTEDALGDENLGVRNLQVTTVIVSAVGQQMGIVSQAVYKLPRGVTAPTSVLAPNTVRNAGAILYRFRHLPFTSAGMAHQTKIGRISVKSGESLAIAYQVAAADQNPSATNVIEIAWAARYSIASVQRGDAS